jgi:hypothetical protein
MDGMRARLYWRSNQPVNRFTSEDLTNEQRLFGRTAVGRVSEHPGIDTVGGRRRIGDAAIARTRYPF